MNEILKCLISKQRERSISFKEYVDTVLYHEEYGYYMHSAEKIGIKGDFYTNANIRPFSEILGKWFLQLFEEKKVPPVIIELGGGTGEMAEGILSSIGKRSPETMKQLTYILLERSSYHRQLQYERLSEYSNVKFISISDELPSITGIVFSNELFDAFPVYVITKKEGELKEVGVGMKEDRLREVLVRLDHEEIIRYMRRMNMSVDEGQRVEVPIPMTAYYYDICSRLKSGLIVTIDYGYTDKEWSSPERKAGSLRGYVKHRFVDDVFLQPGKMDITAHIRWGDLIRTGEEAGLSTASFLTQQQFLLDCGILSLMREESDRDPFSAQHRRNRQIRMLIQDGQISSYFQVLIQEKNAAKGCLFQTGTK